MKVVVVSGERQVSISAKGDSRKLLAQMAATAQHLLTVTPEPPKPIPFGFSCVSETEIAQED